MKLGIKDYLPLCLTTEAPPEHVGRTRSQEDHLRSIRVTHGILGLASEIQELLAWFDKGFQLAFSSDRQAWLVNLKEELGDLYWYSGILLDALGQIDPLGLTVVQQDIAMMESRPYKPATSPEGLSRLVQNTITDLSRHVGTLADKQKRYLHYGAPYPFSLVAPDDMPEAEPALSPMMCDLLSIFTLLHQLCKWHGLEAGDVRDANIRKLYKRFRDKFNANKALNRDLLAEYEALLGDTK